MSGRELEQSAVTGAPGEVLRDTRESSGITQREVADALNLPMATVQALESGDEEQLPAPVFTRGYVRAYAKLLELDPEPLMTAMGDETEEPFSVDTSSPTTSSLGTSALILQSGLRPKYIAALVAIVVVIALLTMWLMSNDGADENIDVPVVEMNAELDSADQTNAGVGATTQMQAPANALAELQSDTTEMQNTAEETGAGLDSASSNIAGQPVNESQVAAVQANESSNANTAASGALVAQTQAAPATGDSARRLTADGSDKLRLLFTEECWVEIKTTEGKTLFGDLGRAGQSFEFVGRAPFKVLLGYAPGALLEFNDEPVALSPHTRNNVASLVLGQ